MSKVLPDNRAWQLVIEAGEALRPVPLYTIGRNAGVAIGKVEAMAGRFHVMKRAGIEPTGDWWHDRVVVQLPAIAA